MGLHEFCVFISSLKIKHYGKHVVFIVGWYGTETTGDKAILGGIIIDYQKKYKNLDFVIASLEPFITEQTLKELSSVKIVYNDFMILR